MTTLNEAITDAKKIKAYYSALDRRKWLKNRTNEPVDEEEIENCIADDREHVIQQEKQIIMSQFKDSLIPPHSMTYNGKNLCEKTELEWKKLSKNQLDTIAKHLDIRVKSKASVPILTLAIKDKLSTCSCTFTLNAFKIIVGD